MLIIKNVGLRVNGLNHSRGRVQLRCFQKERNRLVSSIEFYSLGNPFENIGFELGLKRFYRKSRFLFNGLVRTEGTRSFLS